MKTTFLQLLFILIFLFPEYSHAQANKITGTVMAFDKFPLNNVEIRAKKAKTVTQTDKEGHFNLSVNKKDILIVKDPVFEEFKKKVDASDTPIRINLFIRTDETSMKRVVDRGYISSDNLDFGMKHLAKNNNIFYQFRDVWDAIHYAIPEANIIEEGGRKGVQFRGNKSALQSDLALIVIDGVIVNDPGYLPTSKIFRITRLTGSAVALYGSRAANGVVSIETIR